MASFSHIVADRKLSNQRRDVFFFLNERQFVWPANPDDFIERDQLIESFCPHLCLLSNPEYGTDFPSGGLRHQYLAARCASSSFQTGAPNRTKTASPMNSSIVPP